MNKKVLIGLLVTLMMAIITLVTLMMAIITLSGCIEEEGQYLESFIIHVGEKRQITGTNYSVVLKDCYREARRSEDNSISVDIYNGSELIISGRIVIEGEDPKEEDNLKDRIIIGDLKILLDNVPTDDSAKISIYRGGNG